MKSNIKIQLSIIAQRNNTFGIIGFVELLRKIEIKGAQRIKREIFELKIFCRLCIIRAMIANIGVPKCIIEAMTTDDWCAKN
jgi:hypothetical protein